jgi:arginine:pyruvate transaminase
MPKTSPLISRISGPESAAWDVGDLAYERMSQGQDIIHLGVGDPDLDTPVAIRESLLRALDAGKTHYSPLAGEQRLREAIASHARSLYGGDIRAEQVVVCNGAQGALFSTFLSIAGVGDEVVILEPAYATYPAVVQAGGATAVRVVLEEENGYQLDIDKIRTALNEKTRAVLVNSPGNPSGAVFSSHDMNNLARLCAERGVWLVSDEVYWSFCYDGEHVSPYQLEQTRSSVIVINSLSKSHAMTGWRIGWAIATPEMAMAMATLAQSQYFGINQFVQEAAITALGDNESMLGIHEVFKSRRNAFVKTLGASDALHFSAPQGGMFLLLDVSRTGLDGREFAERLLDEERVAVVPGFGFGSSVNNMIRVGFLCEEMILEEAAGRIVRFAEKLVGDKKR